MNKTALMIINVIVSVGFGFIADWVLRRIHQPLTIGELLIISIMSFFFLSLRDRIDEIKDNVKP